MKRGKHNNLQNSSSEDKRKHLEFIQGTINRLFSNAFLLKGWFITVLVAIISAEIATRNFALSWLVLVTTVLFWAIDAYYLMLERGYCQLYKEAANKAPDHVDFSMDIGPYVSVLGWLKCLMRPALLMLYGSVFIATFCVIIGSCFEIKLLILPRS